MQPDSAREPLKVWTGRHVEIELVTESGETERMSLDVVADSAADFARGFLGEGTPLGKALLGKQAGDTITYRAGDIVEARLLAVSDTLSAPPEDLTERRAEVTRKALEQSDNTSLLIYASAMNSKWGDYDPAVLQQDDDSADGPDNHEKPETGEQGD